MEHLMMKIDTFLEAWEQDEKTKEQQRYKRSRPSARSTKMPKSFFKHPVYQDLKEVIISLRSQIVIPRRWEELEIDFTTKDVRYCSLCDTNVYKVSNFYNYQKLLDKNVTLAIPISGSFMREIENQYKIAIESYKFVQISRRIMQEAGYRIEDDLHSCELESVVDDIVKYLSAKDWISMSIWSQKYRKFGFELEDFLHIFQIDWQE
jgi:hypothetical protein